MKTFNLNLIPNQPDRVAIVTGANVGLGYETARGLAQKEIKVIMACRNMAKASAAKSALLQQNPDAKLEVMELDLGSLASVKNFAKAFSEKYDRLDLLINNAGLMVPPFQKTEEGFESQFGVNYLAHFLLTNLMMPLLLKTKASRIVTLSSIAHRNGTLDFENLNSQKYYSKWEAYGRSKLACLVFAYELQRRLEASGHQTISVAAHPGVSNTNLSRHLPGFMKMLLPVLASVMTQSAWKGAQPTLYAALGEDIRGGDYCGPDGWREWKGKATKVRSSRLSQNEQLAQQLWEASEKLTGHAFSL